MEDLFFDELTIQIEDHNNEIIMKWKGKSRNKQPSETLIPYLNGIHQELKGKKLIIDFKDLQRMNSSTVPSIVLFIKTLEKNGVETTILYDNTLAWQKASFMALETVILRYSNISIYGD